MKGLSYPAIKSNKYVRKSGCQKMGLNLLFSLLNNLQFFTNYTQYIEFLLKSKIQYNHYIGFFHFKQVDKA